MNISRILTEYLDSLENARIGLVSPSIIAPFVAFGLLQGVVLSLFAFFPLEPLAPLMVPVVRLVAGPEGLHYPKHFVMLPTMFRNAYLPLVALVGFPLWTWAAWMIIDRHEVGRRLERVSFHTRWPDAAVVGIVFTFVSVSLGSLVSWATGAVPRGLPAIGVGTAGVLVVAGAQALLLYAPVMLRLRPVGAVGAIRASARCALAGFGPTLAVVLTVLAVNMPLDFMIGNANRVVVRFHPETMYYLLMASIAVETVMAYVMFSAVVGLALAGKGGPR